MSMPISSVNPETVFSYAGELVTKRTSLWGVSSVEAMVLVNDFTRQCDYSFNVVLEEMQALIAEKNAHDKAKKEEARAAKRAKLRAQLDELEEAAEEEGERWAEAEEAEGDSRASESD
jgi:hypothetical protein